MNCDWVKTNATFYAYDELSDAERHDFEAHCARCTECAAELAAVREFRMSMSAMPQLEPSASLLAASRMRLQEALETAEPVGKWHKYFDLSRYFSQVKFAPALATALFAVGFTGGTLMTWSIANSKNPTVAGLRNGNQPQQVDVAEASIAGIRNIVKDPSSNKVTINYDTLAPSAVEGSLDDPRIQQLLLFAAKNNTNSGLRLDSVNLLTTNTGTEPVREALMFSLKYDQNPGVRLKALEGLGSYVKDDIRVRDSVLEALLNDSNSGVRQQAIQLLSPVKADGSVRSALESLSQRDDNVFIRNESRRMIATLPEID